MMTNNTHFFKSKNAQQMLYVHVPFCDKKCYYCNFVSYQNKTLVKQYFQALLKEIVARKNNKVVTSIFIGGGTPTSVHPFHIKNVLKTIKQHYTLSKNCEITVEANPSSTTLFKMRTYFNSGINRISFGVQSLDEKQLEVLGRTQTKKQVEKAISFAKQAGFKKISADLMLGLPLQTKQQVLDYASQLMQLGINHFSAYMLILEPGTKLEHLISKGDVVLPSEDSVVEIYNALYNFFKQNNFDRYEVSNFAKNNLISKHNLGYWQMKQYLGFGVGAHSFFNMQRSYNTSSLKLYIENSKPESENISKQQYNEEAIMLGLRTKFGIHKSFVSQSKNLNMLLKQKFVKQEGDYIKVCEDKFGVLNSIILKLVE